MGPNSVIMQISYFDGTSEERKKLTLATFGEAEKIIRECAAKPFALLSLDEEDEDYISLLVNINGEFARLTYMVEDPVDEEDEDWDDCENCDCEFSIWTSLGHHNGKVKFLTGKGNKTSAEDGEFVVTLDQAIECVKQFFENGEMPDCIEWERIS